MAQIIITTDSTLSSTDNAFAATIDREGGLETFTREMSVDGQNPPTRIIAHFANLDDGLFSRAMKVLGTGTQEETVAALSSREGWNVYVDVPVTEVLSMENMKLINE